MPTRPATSMLTRTEEHFSREADEYQHASSTGLWAWWRERERREVFRLLRPRDGEVMLDAGSGAGYYTAKLLEAGVQVIATDLSLPMVRHARSRLGVPAFVSNIEEFHLRGRFTGVLCAGALEFCPHPGRALRQLALLLRGGASRLVIMLPSDGLPGRLYRRFHARHGIRVNLFSRRRLRALAASAGLRIVEWGSVGFNHVLRLAPRGAAS